MFPRPVAASIAILALCLVACGGRDKSASTQTPTGTPAQGSPTLTPAPLTSTPPPTATLPPSTPDPDAPQLPLDTNTGIAAADHFLSLLANRDFATIAAEAVFPPQLCTEQDTGIPGKPICGPGAAEGDLVPAELFGSCEPGFIAPDKRQRIVDRLDVLFSAPDRSLNSVWQTDAHGASYAIAVDYSSQIPGASGTEIFYVDGQGHFAGSTACGDYDVPVGSASRLFPP